MMDTGGRILVNGQQQPAANCTSELQTAIIWRRLYNLLLQWVIVATEGDLESKDDRRDQQLLLECA
jgi:hypothetical protein